MLPVNRQNALYRGKSCISPASRGKQGVSLSVNRRTQCSEGKLFFPHCGGTDGIALSTGKCSVPRKSCFPPLRGKQGVSLSVGRSIQCSEGKLFIRHKKIPRFCGGKQEDYMLFASFSIRSASVIVTLPLPS